MSDTTTTEQTTEKVGNKRKLEDEELDSGAENKRQKTKDTVNGEERDEQNERLSQSSEVLEEIIRTVENDEAVNSSFNEKNANSTASDVAVKAADKVESKPGKIAKDDDKENITTVIDLSGQPETENKSVAMEEEKESDLKEAEKLAIRRQTHLKFVQEIHDELRMEEAKLILMKKLRQSQLQRTQPSGQNVNSSKEVKPSTKIMSSSYNSKQSQQQHNSIQQTTLKKQQQTSQSQSALNALMQLPGFLQGNLLNLQQFHNKSMQQKESVNLAMQQFMNHQKLMIEQQKMLDRSKKPKPNYPSVQQSLAAAKLALRKQLEQTLLEIPPPQPPPPEITFLPSAASTEFICLLGLEYAVNKIQMLQDKNYRREIRDRNEEIPEAMVCIQCKSDFSPLWKKVKNSNHVVCHQCVTTNQKKALKAEHTNRLKTAFVKALQQEQEIEKRMQDEEAQLKKEQSSAQSQEKSSFRQQEISKQPQMLSSSIYQFNSGLLKANERQMLLDMLPEGKWKQQSNRK